MKKNNKRIVTIILLGALLAISLPFSFAWFFVNKDVSLNSDEDFLIEVGQSLEISKLLGKDQQGKEIWSDYTTKPIEVSSPILKDCSSNGTKFAYPMGYDPNTNEALFPLLDVGDNEAVGYYVEVTVKLRTNITCGIYLTNNSYILPADETLHPTPSVWVPGVSCNNIAGAMRASFTEDTMNSSGTVINRNLKQIWIPNDHYQLSYDSKGDPIAFTQNGYREESYGYIQNAASYADRYKYYSTQDYLDKKILVGNNLADPKSSILGSSTNIVDFVNNGTIQERRITIRVWFEGTDREADSAFNKGKCQYRIAFGAITKQTRSTADDQFLDTLVPDATTRKLFLDAQKTVEVSADHNIQISPDGIDWYDYPMSYQTPTPEPEERSGIPYFWPRQSRTHSADKDSKWEYVYYRNKETPLQEHIKSVETYMPFVYSEVII